MYNFILSVVVTVVSGLFNITSASGVPTYFESGSIQEAQIKASQEGKLLFVDFYADWCTPCKWMDQTVFTDPSVALALKKDFVAYKVNIDDLEGFELKQKYDVSVLPTMIILNSNGKMVERIEETMTSTEFLDVLSLHNQSGNKMVVQHTMNVSPENTSTSKDRESTERSYLRYIESDDKRLRNYRMKIGSYVSYEDAHSQVASLKKSFLEPIIVVNDIQDGVVHFNVMMGEFATASEAESFRDILRNDFAINAEID